MTKNIKNVLEKCKALTENLAGGDREFFVHDIVYLRELIEEELKELEPRQERCEECGRMLWREHRKGCQRGCSPLTNA